MPKLLPTMACANLGIVTTARNKFMNSDQLYRFTGRWLRH